MDRAIKIKEKKGKINIEVMKERRTIQVVTRHLLDMISLHDDVSVMLANFRTGFDFDSCN
jgi:hypothetical protein